MADKYLPKEFEKKWMEEWSRASVYKTQTAADKPKNYVLVMFPYPSGAGLHVGHARVYFGPDVLARFFRMKGYNLLYPMGWDAFGLPAENAAIKAKKNPIDMVPAHIATFKRQMQMLGLSYDWDRELATTDPDYYKWTQWLFIQFFKMGLLYKKVTSVFFCPFCKTGLAQEEILPNGTHERCGKEITTKDLPQWIFRITTYADRLADDLKGLDWPKGILDMQKNWIGRKEGMTIKHKVKEMDMTFETFTAYPAWSFADTFVVIAPEHPLVEQLVKGTDHEKSVKDFVEESKKITPEERTVNKFEKKGVFTGRYAIDPFSGNEMPIWLANFALMDFGTGIIRCSAHDPRDFEFAQKYNIPLKEVVERSNPTEPVNAHKNSGVLKDSGPFTGQKVEDVLREVQHWIIKKEIGKQKVSYHLRDWIFSRQRYWGEPIPMIYCQKCADKKISWWDTFEGEEFLKDHQSISKVDKEHKKTLYGWFPVDQKNLPLELPYLKSYEPTGTGESPLARVEDWVDTSCPNCDGEAQRETDTMPNWAGSCWYFLAFTFSNKLNLKSEARNPKETEENSNKPNLNHLDLNNSDLFRIWDLEFRASINDWSPVDWYIGGAEHAVLHLLYARFWVKALQDLKLLNFSEPFMRLRNVGMVLAEDHRKMSKSLGNVINPDDVVSEYGADALRVYEMFMAPFDQEIPWSTKNMQGAYRFVTRVWNIYQKYHHAKLEQSSKFKVEEDKSLVGKLNKTIEKVTNDIPQMKFNTCVAAMMEFLNEWAAKASKKDNYPTLSNDNAKKFLQLLAPFAPFMAEEIWHNVFGEKESIHLQPWPTVDDTVVVEKEKVIPVQINGKVRGKVTILRQDYVGQTATEQEVAEKVLSDEKLKSFIEGKKYKVIYVQDKIVNFIIT